MIDLLIYIKPRLEPKEILEKLTTLPPELEGVIGSKSIRLSKLQNIYNVFIPLPIAVETYYKLYESLVRAIKKKMLPIINKQQIENYKAIKGKELSGIMGGVDSISIIGNSGTGKTTTISRVVSLMTNEDIISFSKPYKVTIIPCLIVNCPFDSSVKTLMVEIMRMVDNKIGSNYYEGTVRTTTTTGMLIAAVSNILINHVGLLIIDEYQNVIKSRNGINLVGALTQLVNSCGVSIVMVANPEIKPFIEQDLKMSRRSIGLEYKPLNYDDTYFGFVKQLLSYQFTLKKVEITKGLLETIYEGTGGIPALIVSLIHDAQEKAIIDDLDAVSVSTILDVLKERYTIIQSTIETSPRKPSKGQKKHIETIDYTSNEVIDEKVIENAVKNSKKNISAAIDLLKKQIEVIEL